MMVIKYNVMTTTLSYVVVKPGVILHESCDIHHCSYDHSLYTDTSMLNTFFFFFFLGGGGGIGRARFPPNNDLWIYQHFHGDASHSADIEYVKLYFCSTS